MAYYDPYVMKTNFSCFPHGKQKPGLLNTTVSFLCKSTTQSKNDISDFVKNFKLLQKLEMSPKLSSGSRGDDENAERTDHRTVALAITLKSASFKFRNDITEVTIVTYRMKG